MKIFNAAQIRRWDQFTILHEPIQSIELMERAATACAEWVDRFFPAGALTIFCGKGNNGGDGLAIARLLSSRKVTVYILEFGHKGTDDFQTNLSRLHQFPGVDIRFVQTSENIADITVDGLIIDALFGSGLNRALEGTAAQLVQHLNRSAHTIVSIDIPSGMFTDRSSSHNTQVKAAHTLCFQTYKQAFLMAENGPYFGEVHLLDIGLHQEFYDKEPAEAELTDAAMIYPVYQPRSPFGHKGTYGHALLVAGSYGKVGAAVLSAEACLRSGTGLVTCHLPSCGYQVMQTALPEVMVSADVNHAINTIIETDLSIYKTIGIGPGLGTAAETRELVFNILSTYRRPVVLDADALNGIAKQPDQIHNIPPGSILTPHPKEFQRLFGDTADEFERNELAVAKAKQLNLVIILKGHHTLIALPSGQRYFNATGNAGMATGGSGDVLTGILTGLLAQGYSAANAAILGVYLHGLAGDLAAAAVSMEAMIAGDIIKHLGAAFLNMK